MIVEILKIGRSSKPALNYNEKKVASGEASVIGTNAMYSDSFREQIIREIECDPRVPGAVTNRSFHMAVNPAEGEEMTDDRARELVKDIMNGLGYGKQPYIIYKHFDIDRIHYHVVSTRIKKDTRERIDYRFEHRRCNDLMKSLAEKYGYYPGKRPSERQVFYHDCKFSRKRGDVVNQVNDIVKFVAVKYAYTSLEDFADIIRAHNVEVKVESTFGQKRLIFQGMSGGRTCTPELDTIDRKGELMEKLEDICRMNEQTYRLEQIRQQREALAVELDNAFDRASDRRHFENLLRKRGVMVREYEQRIKGSKEPETRLLVTDMETGLCFKFEELETEMTMSRYLSLPAQQEEKINTTIRMKF